jgi:hypothetical protein
MSATAIGRRLVLKLDADMPFESLILQRLIRLPASRRHDWLRTLLVEGFKAECRSLRELQGGVHGNPDTLPMGAGNAASESGGDGHVAQPAPVTRARTAITPAKGSCPAEASVTFASLRRVIG